MDDIKRFISQFTDRKIGNIKKIGRRYFLVNETLEKKSQEIKADIFSIGVYLGETRGSFRPTPALIEEISKTSDKKIVINKKAEWLFLCGRDVFADNIVKKSNSEIVLVQNERDENLGYGKMIKNKTLLKNMMDKGDYLRREN